MNYQKQNDGRRFELKSRTRKVVLSALLFSLVAFVCLKLTRPAQANIIVSRTGVAPNFTVTFNNDGTAPVDNRLELHFNAANQLEYSINGGVFTNNLGGGNTATFANINNIVTNFGAGTNTLVVNLQQFAFAASVAPDFSNSQQVNTNLMDTGTGHNVGIQTTGGKVIHFAGANFDDSLVVTPGQGDSTARIDNGATVFADEVRASDLSALVEFDSLNSFTYRDAGIGTNIVTFATQNLAGAQNYSATLDNRDTLVIEGNDAIDDNYLVTRPAAGQVSVTDLTPVPPLTVTLNTSFGSAPPPLRFNTLGGNDILNINVAASDVIPNPITFDGGAGNNLLRISGIPTTAVNSVNYSPGPAVGQGTLVYQNGVGTQLMSIGFLNLAPVIDTTAASTLVVNGTNGSNAINYTQGPNSGTGTVGGAISGQVAVDNLETIEFANKDNLSINGLGGADIFNLNNQAARPTGLTAGGLKNISIDGGGPAGSDTLIVNGIGGGGAATRDELVVNPTAAGGGTISESGSAGATAQANFVSVTFSNLGHLTLVGQTADLDQVASEGTPGNDTFEIIPGATPDSSTITGFSTGAGAFNFVPIQSQGFAGLVVTPFDGGGADTVIVDGTPADDIFSFGSSSPPGSVGGPFQTVQLTTGGQGYTPIIYSSLSVSQVILRGGAGSDTFNINLKPTVGNLSVAIKAEGGDGTDTLNYTAPASAATTIDYGAGTIGSSGPSGNPVSFNDIETINETSAGAGATLTVNGTSGGDNISFGPTGSNAGTVTLAGLSSLINFVGTGTLTLNGMDGNDFFTITPSSTVTVNVNGGNPTPPASPGDSLNVNTAGTTGFSQTNSSGPTGLSGSFTFTNRAAVNFQQIETLSPLIVSAKTFNAVEGVPFTNQIVAGFNAAAIAAGNFTSTINWGDGSASSAGVVVANGSGGTFNVQGGHTYAEEGSYDVVVKVTDLTSSATQQTTSTATVADAPLSIVAQAPGSNTTFSGIGGNNTSVTPGTANAAMVAFQAAIGGVNNGGTASPQNGGFRTINWDGVALTPTDGIFNNEVIVPNHVVGIPTNRFQTRGVSFEEIYAVSDDGFVSVNPNAAGQFPAFSPTKTFAMFNDNTIDFSFVLPSAANSPPIGALSRGFGAIFLDVETPNTTSIEYFNGTTSLGKFFVPAGGTGQPEFLGVLFQNQVITNVEITLGNAKLFSFDGTTFTAGDADTPPASDLVATDDFVYAEPSAVGTGITLNATAGTPFTAKVASFTDADPQGQASDYSVVIDWGDGTSSSGGVTPNAAQPESGIEREQTATITSNLNGGWDVTGTHTYTTTGVFHITTAIRDTGGASIGASSTAIVSGISQSGSMQFSASTASVAESAPTVTLTVNRTGDTSQASSVHFETSDGTAVQKSDYTFNSGTVQFAPGDTSKTIAISIVNDDLVEGNQTFFVTLSSPSFNYVVGSPSSVAVTILDDDTVPPTTNPIDDATFFVRQHYLDFLGREPDPSGLTFWTNQITSCGANVSCIAAARVNVSAAFFFSIEYQETSGDVIRTQRVAFGRQSSDASSRVSYLQFMEDTRQVGAGVIVGQPGFDTLLEQNKQGYATQIVNSAAFLLRFPIVPAANYVDAVYASAGVTPTAAERTAAINAFGAGGTSGRVAALRSVADSNTLRQAEFAPSFVLAEFFGYLRRNPTDPPDNNDSGYQFWLAKLNSFNGDFQKAEMVKAFIASSEYRQRFGP